MASMLLVPVVIFVVEALKPRSTLFVCPPVSIQSLFSHAPANKMKHDAMRIAPDRLCFFRVFISVIIYIVFAYKSKGVYS